VRSDSIGLDNHSVHGLPDESNGHGSDGHHHPHVHDINERMMYNLRKAMYELAPTSSCASFPPLLASALSTTRNYLPRCLRLYHGTSQEFLSMLPHMASMFVIGATATLSNSLPYPARYGHAIRYAVLHTFPFNAHLSLIVNTLVSPA